MPYARDKAMFLVRFWLCRIEELAKVCVFVVAIALVMLLVTALIFNVTLRFDRVTAGLVWQVDALALVALAVAACVTVLLLQVKSRRVVCAVVSALAPLIAALASVFFLRPEWISDFATMWARAQEFRSVDLVVRDIYDQRVQLLLVPAVRALGTSEWVVPVLNLFCLGAALFAGSIWVRRVAGPAAALLFCIVLASVPELLLALGIPTHDIWALPWIVLSALAIQQSLREVKWQKSVLWAAVGAFAMVLLQVQREIGHVAFLAALLSYIVTAALVPKSPLGQQSEVLPHQSRQAAASALACALALVLIYPAGSAVARSIGMFADYQDLVHARVGGVTPSAFRGTYGDGRVFADNFLEVLDPSERGDFASDVALSDTVLQPERRVPNALHRMKTLSYLGSQTYFYVPGLDREHPRLAAGIASLTSWHAAAFALLVLWSLIGMWRGGYWQPYLYPILFSSILAAGLVLVGEVQPRYLIPLWITGSMMVASLAPQVTRLQPFRLLKPVAYLALLGLLVYAGWKIVDRRYSHMDGRVLEWSLPAGRPAQGAAFAALMGDERFNAIGALGFAMQLPESSGPVSGEAQSQACTASKSTLEFFYYMPYHQTYALGYFDLTLLVDGTPRWSVALPSAPGIQHAAVDLPEGCLEFTFRLSADRGTSDASWVNASRTEIYFPRVVVHSD